MEGFALQAPDVSLALLLALWPLAREKEAVQSYFVRVLRRAMYGRDVASRLFAMRGFLFVILEGVKHGASQKVSESQVRLRGHRLASPVIVTPRSRAPDRPQHM